MLETTKVCHCLDEYGSGGNWDGEFLWDHPSIFSRFGKVDPLYSNGILYLVDAMGTLYDREGYACWNAPWLKVCCYFTFQVDSEYSAVFVVSKSGLNFQLWKSTDRMRNWTLVNDALPIAVSASIVGACMSNGSIILGGSLSTYEHNFVVSHDGGITWLTCGLKPHSWHLLGILPMGGQSLIFHYSNHLYFSSDFGVTLREIKAPFDDYISSKLIKAEGARILLVDVYELRVAVSVDNGESWNLLREGNKKYIPDVRSGFNVLFDIAQSRLLAVFGEREPKILYSKNKFQELLDDFEFIESLQEATPSTRSLPRHVWMGKILSFLFSNRLRKTLMDSLGKKMRLE